MKVFVKIRVPLWSKYFAFENRWHRLTPTWGGPPRPKGGEFLSFLDRPKWVRMYTETDTDKRGKNV